MDNYAKIQMKKLIFTLTLAFVTVCGFAQEKVWEDVVTGYRTSTVFDVNKVWFYPDRTDVLLHVEFPYRLIDRGGNLLDVNADPRNLDAFENLVKAL